MADLNALRTILANGGADLPTLNAIRQLLDSGTSMPSNAGGATASFDAPNAMRDALDSQQGPPADMSEFGIRDSQRPVSGGSFGSLDHELQDSPGYKLRPEEVLMRDALAAQAGDQGAYSRVQSAIQGGQSAQPSTQDLRKQGANFVRNEDTGQTIYLTPQGMSDTPPGVASGMRPASGTQPASAPAQAPRMMQVIGTGGGTRVTLPPEQAPDKVNLDYSRPALQVIGGAKAIYSKDEPGVAYVLGADGRPVSKVLLGYDMQGSMALNKANADMAQTQAQTAHTQEETRASQVNNPDFTGSGGGGAPQVNMNLTGDPFLKQLDPGIANEVKALGDGKTPFNPRSQRQLNLLALVQQYNPNWSATDYQEKLATTKSFAPGGTDGKAIQGINQAIIHAGEAVDKIKALNNTGIAPGIVNAPLNLVQQKLFNDTRQVQLNAAFTALGEELKKAYGGNSLAQLENWQKNLDPNASVDQQLASVGEAMKLLEGAVASRQQQYQRGMGSPLDFGKVLDPKAQAALAKLEQGKVAPDLRGALGLSGPQVAQSSSQQVFQSLPNPAQFAGKRMQDDKGNTYRSDGSRWVRA